MDCNGTKRKLVAQPFRSAVPSVESPQIHFGTRAIFTFRKTNLNKALSLSVLSLEQVLRDAGLVTFRFLSHCSF